MNDHQSKNKKFTSTSNTSHEIGLYVHLPFCETKCPYCDFNTYSSIEPLIPRYLSSLCREVDIWGQLLDRRETNTIFFGGGTPSYIPGDGLGLVMKAIGDSFQVKDCAEITVEINPGDLTRDKLEHFKNSKFNRLSIGVQSFDNTLLKLLGRRHTAQEASTAYRTAIEAGFENVSIDLMYGLPNQTLNQWIATLDSALNLSPKHMSMYELTLEQGTPMHHQVKTGLLPKPDQDLAADMYILAQDKLASFGYHNYEISNWAKPQFQSLHNLTYWKNKQYLGVGPGAHSYISGNRFHNIKSPREYTQLLENSMKMSKATRVDAGLISKIPVVEIVNPISKTLEMSETMMMGLRLDIGINVQEFLNRFGCTPSFQYGEIIRELELLGLLEANTETIKLTSRGRMLGNEVFSRFLD